MFCEWKIIFFFFFSLFVWGGGFFSFRFAFFFLRTSGDRWSPSWAKCMHARETVFGIYDVKIEIVGHSRQKNLHAEFFYMPSL